MTDQDYIRKAVELADGWSWRGKTYLGRTDDPTILVNTPSGAAMGITEPMMIDALAAQLVRQSAQGTDHAMNTIKAIVLRNCGKLS